MKARVLWLATLLLAAANTYSAAPSAAWVQRHNGPGNSEDGPTALLVDQNGTAFVCGYSVGANGYIDFATIAYSSDGAALWTNRFDGAAHTYDSPKGMALDPGSGTLYVAGYSYSTNRTEAVTIAYSSSGVALWTNRYSEPQAGAEVSGICFAAGTVYVAAAAGGMVAHGVTLAYSSAGTALWTNRTSVGYAAKVIAADSSGTLYAAGPASDAHYMTIAYSPTGAALWTNRYVGPAGMQNTVGAPLAIAVEETPPPGAFSGSNERMISAKSEGYTNLSAQIYVTGYSEGFGPGYDYATVAYSTNGVPVWTNRYSGPGASWDSASAIAVDKSNGAVYVTGSGAEGCVTIAYSRAGGPLWTNRFAGSGNAIATDSKGTVIVAGAAGDSGDPDFLTVAYSSTGIPLWTNRYSGPAGSDDRAFCVALGKTGAIYVAGETSYYTTNGDILTIKYAPAPPAITLSSIAVLKTGACVLTINAPENTAFRLEASGNLTAWQTLTNFPPVPTNQLQYTDALAGFSNRYYRTAWPP